MPKVRRGWLVGRWNGEPIVGCELKLVVDLGQLRSWRHYLPLLRWNFGQPYIIWLAFQIRAGARYGW